MLTLHRIVFFGKSGYWVGWVQYCKALSVFMILPKYQKILFLLMSTEMKVNGSNKEICLKQFLSKLAGNWLKKKIKKLVHTSTYIGGKIGRVIIRSEDVFRNEIIIDFQLLNTVDLSIFFLENVFLSSDTHSGLDGFISFFLKNMIFKHKNLYLLKLYIFFGRKKISIK